MTRSREILLVLLLLAVAAFFRLYKLDSIPPGLYPDVAMNGNNAVQALETGNFKFFYPENNGREGLMMNIQALSVRFFGTTAYALKFPAAIAGILTVWGLYLLAQRMFNWQIAAIAGFLMAVSFWHVNFSRIGFRAILAPLCIVWGLYFFWKGLSTSRRSAFLASGLFWGLGFHTYISFRIMPFMLLATAAAFWLATKREFDRDRFLTTRHQLFQGMVLLGLAALVITAPLAWHFYVHPEDFLGRLNKVSIFSSDNPLVTLLKNTGQTLAMFNFIGDHNWRHNIAGRPALYWPVGIFAILGFFKSFLRLEHSWRKRGHLSPAHVMMQAWFWLGLAPVILSTEGIPHALRGIIVVPVVFLFAAEGLWWFFEFSKDWWLAHDVHRRHMPFTHRVVPEGAIVGTVAVAAFLVAVGIMEYRAYFVDWGHRLEVSGEFNQNYVDVANKINSLPRSKITYVYVNRDTGVWQNGVPITAQTVMYLTDTYTQEKQQAKNIYYLTEQQYKARQYLPNATIIPLESKK